MNEPCKLPVLTIKQPVFYGYKGDMLTVISDTPIPPGSRIDFPLNLKSADKAIPVRGKIVASVPIAGGFRITIRLNSLSREDRNSLTSESQQ